MRGFIFKTHLVLTHWKQEPRAYIDNKNIEVFSVKKVLNINITN